MNIPTPKFKPGQKVYANLKTGMELCTVETVLIKLNMDSNCIKYVLKEDWSDTYDENLVHGSHKQATARLEENKTQLLLALN